MASPYPGPQHRPDTDVEPRTVRGPTTAPAPAPDPDSTTPTPDVVPLGLRPSTRYVPWIAVGGFALLSLGGWALASTGADDGQFHTVELRSLADGTTVGDATVARRDGDLVLTVDIGPLPPEPGSHYELWLIDLEVTDPRLLSRISGDDEVVLPEGMDPTEYPIVDISLEPDDDMPTHSGQSRFQGTLDVD